MHRTKLVSGGIVLVAGMIASLLFAQDRRVEDAMATLAMLEDTRCPDGRRVAAYLTGMPPEVRARATLALARLQDSTTVDPLADRLARDEDVRVRRGAAFALGQLRDRDGLAALERAYRPEADAELRVLVIEGIGKIGAVEGMGTCVRAMADPDPTVRRAGAIAMWRIGDSGALRPLMDATYDPDPEVRWAVVWALEKIEAPQYVLPELERLHTDEHTEVRRRVARTAGRQGSSEALPMLFALLADDDVGVRVEATRALGRLADSTALPQVLGQLDDPHPYVRETAVVSLGQIGDEVAAVRLGDLADDPVAMVRGAVGPALAALVPADAGLPTAFALLEDESEYVRARSCEALGEWETPASVDVLRGILAGTNRRDEPSGGRERAAAASALGELGDPIAREALLAALEDEEPAVVASAAAALGKLELDDDEVIAALLTAVRENPNPNEPDIAVGGLDALAALGAERAVPLATELLASPQRLVRESAHALLTEVLGEERADELAAQHGPPAWQAVSIESYRRIPEARRAVLLTDAGDVTVELFAEESPLTVKNFADLAVQGYFDGTAFHRVVPNFVVQDGDPSGTGWGGPGYAIRCEYNRRRYGTGAVGMALAGKDTGGSQWFITHAPQPHLDGIYTIFGQVTNGFGVVDRLTVGDRITSIRIEGASD